MADAAPRTKRSLVVGGGLAIVLNLLTACAGAPTGSFGASDNKVFHPTGRTMQTGQLVHVYFDGNTEVGRDTFTYEEYGPQGGKMPKIGRCYFRAAVAYSRRYWRHNEMANEYRRNYPVRPGFVEGRCSTFTNDFTPVGRFDAR